VKRYPALTTYRLILTLLGLAVIGGGMIFALIMANVISAYLNVSTYTVVIFIPLAVMVLVTGGALLVTAELLHLLVNIETRLIEIRDVDKQSANNHNSASSAAMPARTAPAPRAVEAQPDTSALEQLARGQRVMFEGVVTAERVALRTKPNRQASAVRAVVIGQEVGVMARSSDNRWLLVLVENKPYWIQSEAVAPQGNVAPLPVIG